jgi:hypothetical protein
VPRRADAVLRRMDRTEGKTSQTSLFPLRRVCCSWLWDRRWRLHPRWRGISPNQGASPLMEKTKCLTGKWLGQGGRRAGWPGPPQLRHMLPEPAGAAFPASPASCGTIRDRGVATNGLTEQSQLRSGMVNQSLTGFADSRCQGTAQPAFLLKLPYCCRFRAIVGNRSVKNYLLPEP